MTASRQEPGLLQREAPAGRYPNATVHPSAVIDEDVTLGTDTQVWHFVHVSSGARIGDRCSLGQNVFIGHNVYVGHGVRIQNNVSVYAGVHVEDEVFLGPSAVFTNVKNPRAAQSRNGVYETTRVGRGVTVGANATVVCGVALEEYAFVGAGAVVTTNVRAHSLVLGNPARHAGWVCRCAETLPVGSAAFPATTVCSSCGLGYHVSEDQCVLVDP